jgi:tRNA A-37 threonylcarbamoyl transferase component Bud32
MQTAAHPRPDELAAFAQGKLSADESAVIEEHLLACDACAAALERQPEDSLLCAARATATFAETPTSPPHATASGVVTTAPIPADAVGEATEVGEAVPPGLAHHERYRVVRQLGRGGMGAVFEAEHLVMQRPVALKIINRAYIANEAAAERFRREVRAAARLHHPNIVTAFDAENVGETHFLVMEYVEGKSLARLVKERGPLPVRDACDYIRQAALGLQHAHERGMVHRDVKPDNLMLTPDGTVKVLDFGLAALTAERSAGGLTEADVIMGTPAYMAPEQAEDARKADIRADVYSLGCTLYHLLTGSVPYPADTSLLKILAHRERPMPSIRAVRPEVPKELEAILARLLAKKPEDRYQTPGEVADALEPFTQAEAKRPRKRRPLLVAIALAALFAGVVWAGAVVYRIQTDKGEIVIRTDDPDIEIVIKRGGELVRVIDGKSKQTWELDTAKYQIGMADQPDGLRIDLSGKGAFTLRRGEKGVLTITRAAEKGPPPSREPGKADKVGLARRLPWGNRNRGSRVRFSPDGRYCGAWAWFTEGKASGYRIWEVAKGKAVQQLPGVRGVTAFLFTPNGQQLLTGLDSGGQSEITRWDIQTGEKLAGYPVPPRIDPLDVSPDGKWLAVFLGGPDWSQGNSILILDLETGRRVCQVNALHAKSILVAWAQFTADGKQLLTMDADPNAGKSTFRFTDLETKKVARSFEVPHSLGGPFALLEHDRQVAAFYGVEPAGWFVGFWNVEDGKLVRTVKLAMDRPVRATAESVSLSDDGRFLATNHPKEQTVRFFELAKGTQLFACEDIPNPTVVRFSPDGRYAGCDTDDGVYLFRLPEPPAGEKP